VKSLEVWSGICNIRNLILTVSVILVMVPGVISAKEEVRLPQPMDTIPLNGSQLLKEKPRVNLMFADPVEYTAGVDPGIFYDLRADFYLNRYLNLHIHFRLGKNIPKLDSFSAGWDMAPLSCLRFGLQYQLEYFPLYRTLEQNASVVTAFFLKNTWKPRWFDFEFLFGTDFRFIDLDLNNPSAIYLQDWLFEWFILFRIDFLFHPLPWLSTGLSLGNYNQYVFFSANYFQVEFRVIFKLPKDVSLFIKGGFAFAAFFMNPGYINKGWGELGVNYEIPFK
jgi:hypothetical protein